MVHRLLARVATIGLVFLSIQFLLFGEIMQIFVLLREKLVWIVALSLLLAQAPRLNAALLVAEQFNYSSNTALAGANGGTGFSGAWNGALTVSSAGLNYNGLPTAGNAATLVTAGGNSTRQFSSVYEATGTTQWLSLLIRQDIATVNDTNAFGGVVLLPAGSGNGLYVGGGFQDDQTHWGINIAGTGNSSHSGVTIVQGQTVLLVAEISHLSGNDLIQLFVNPSLNSTPTVASATMSNLDLSADKISIRNRDAAWTIDEIRFGDTFSDVVTSAPEPASLAWLALGSVALLILRHRRPAAS